MARQISFKNNDRPVNIQLKDQSLNFKINEVSPRVTPPVPPVEDVFRITEDDDFRILEDGDFRILE